MQRPICKVNEEMFSYLAFYALWPHACKWFLGKRSDRLNQQNIALEIETCLPERFLALDFRNL